MRRVIFRAAFLALCAAAALVPMRSVPAPALAPTHPVWPTDFEGAPLHPLPLSEMEQRFNAGFPGKVARLSDGRRQLICRWITRGTRKLHSSADCFRGLGYTVHPAPPRLDGTGARWSCFTATRGAYRLDVRERISSHAGAQSWTDVSAWFWSVLLRQTDGPWLAVTVVESEAG